MKYIIFMLAMFVSVAPGKAQELEALNNYIINNLDSNTIINPNNGAEKKSPALSEESETVKSKNTYSKVFRVAGQDAQSIMNMAVAYARKQSMDIKTDPAKNTIYIPVAFAYAGQKNECIQALDMKGQLTIQTKDNKTRILLEKLTYEHSVAGNDDNVPVERTTLFTSNQCAPATGSVDELYKCTQCRNSLKSFTDAMEHEFEKQATQYHDFLETRLVAVDY